MLQADMAMQGMMPGMAGGMGGMMASQPMPYYGGMSNMAAIN